MPTFFSFSFTMNTLTQEAFPFMQIVAPSQKQKGKILNHLLVE